MAPEHDEIYEMMMDALDGELSGSEQDLLDTHLRAHPTLMREWQALTAIDTLFRQAPMLTPAADFAQRTIAQLPNRRFHLWTVGLLYLVLLFSGALPMLLGLIAVITLRPILSQPGLLENVWAAILEMAQIGGAVMTALLNGTADLVVQQPALVGWLLVIAGIAAVWGGVYRQTILTPSHTN